MHVCCGVVININNLGTHTYGNKPLVTSLEEVKGLHKFVGR